MSSEQHAAIMRRFFAEVFNEQRVDRADEVVAPDYMDHGAMPGQAPGLEGAKQRWAMFNAAIPDMQTIIEDEVAAGDRVMVRYTVTGTHQGEMMSITPTGRRFRFSGNNITRMAEGKLVEHWAEMDTLGLPQQLGVIPLPGQAEG